MNKFLILASDSTVDWEKIKTTIVDWCLTVGRNILIALLVFIIGRKIIRWVMKLVNKGIGKTKIEPIVAKFLSSIIRCLMYAVLVVIVVNIMGIQTSSLVALVGSAGITIGFGLQGSVANFAGGVLILLFKPFKIDDYIKEDTHNNEGTVIGIDLLYTKLLTIDNRKVIVPNGTLANSSIMNFTAMGKRIIELMIGISYESNIKKAKEVIQDIVNSQKDVLLNEAVTIFVSALEDSQVTIGVRVFTTCEKYWATRWELIERIKIALDENGIVIPFNQLSVTLKQQENSVNKENGEK